MERHAFFLADILNVDERLNMANGSGTSGQLIHSTVFLEQSAAWMKRRRGETYTILLDGWPIGTISISKADLPEGHGRVGYWLASKYWRKGYGAAAFDQLLAIARSEGYKQVEANFSDNASPASAAIWKRKGAIFLDEHSATIDLCPPAS